MEEIKFNDIPRCPNCNGIINAAYMPQGYSAALKQNAARVLAFTVCAHCTSVLLLKDHKFILIPEQELNKYPIQIAASVKAAIAYIKQRTQYKNN